MLLAVTMLQNQGTSRGYLQGHLAEQAGDSSVLPFHSEPLCCFCLCVCACGVFSLRQTLPVSHSTWLQQCCLHGWTFGMGPEGRQEVKGSKAPGVGFATGIIITATALCFRSHAPVSRGCGVPGCLNIVFFLGCILIPTYWVKIN